MATTTYAPRLADKYKKEVVPALMKKFGYTSVMQAPRLQKICLNRGVNGAVTGGVIVSSLGQGNPLTINIYGLLMALMCSAILIYSFRILQK